jgi:FAD/FMN-containing dehydrogenase
MTAAQFAGAAGEAVGLQLIADFVATLDCDVVTPRDTRYEAARQIYNRYHDLYPTALIRTLNRDDLRSVLAFARDSGAELAIRGGGHHIGGLGTSHGGIVVDFSPFRQVTPDLRNGVVHVQPGATLKDLDEATSPHAMVVPTGTVSQTGIGGLTLGGGIGWLIGAYGLTCDNLVGADVMLADGEVVRAGDPDHADLLWALRGGGGNFGMVLNYTYRLRPLPKLTCGSYRVTWQNAAGVLSALVRFMLERCPPELTIAPALLRDAAGTRYLSVDFCAFESCTAGVGELARIVGDATPERVGTWVYSAWQSSFDSLFLTPMRGYWKAKYLTDLTPQTIAVLLQRYEACPGDARCAITIEHLHGAFRHISAYESAFGHRNMNFGVLVSTRWLSQHDDAANTRWVRDAANELDPDLQHGSYVNYSPLEPDSHVSRIYGEHYERLRQIKRKYDPDNLFRRNHNL